MKSRLYIAGIVFTSLLSYSCSNDDEFANPEANNNNFKITSDVSLKNELKKTIDSTVIFNAVSTVNGDPSNPKPPRN